MGDGPSRRPHSNSNAINKEGGRPGGAVGVLIQAITASDEATDASR